MLNEIKPGLFAVEDTMPCLPSKIRLMRWALPSTLDRAESEEAAARILSFSKELDQWVGVSYRTLCTMMLDEYELYQSIQDAQNHNFDKKRRVERELVSYNLKSFFSFGLYRRFKAAPTADLKEVPEGEVPFSGIFTGGPEHVLTGVRELIANGFLKLVTLGERSPEKDQVDVFMPTPSLIERIMQVQRIVAS